MKKDKNLPDIRVNPLKIAYMENIGKANIDQKDLLKLNLTETLWYSIITTVQNKALNNIAIRGEVTTGKSSVATKILKVIIDEKIRMGKIKIKNKQEYDDYMFKHIKSDQTEYLRFTLEGEEDTAVMIDEFSTLGETGLNSTTETAMYTEHSDLFAQRFVDKVSCSPGYIADRNANVILDIIGKDTEKKITQVKISYRDVITRIPIALGVAFIDVSDVIEEEWYKRYRIKKFKRMELLDKQGVRSIKELEFAKITLDAYKELKEGCRIKKFNNEIILSVVEGVRRRNKMVYSLFTLNYVVMNVKTLVELQSEVYKLEAKLIRSTGEKLGKMINDQLDVFEKLLKERICEEERKLKVLEEYRNIQ